MDIIHCNMDEFITYHQPLAACIGYFDGIHKGHQKLIQTVLDICQGNDCEPALITFEPDPWVVLKGIKDVCHITPMSHRMEIGESLGIKKWIILDFDRRMAQISVEQFHEDILKRLQVKHLVCGQDFHYASKGSGSIETLSHCEDFQLHVVEAVLDNQQRISSTLIEQFIQQGEMQECKRQMGRAFALKGIITKGNQMGRKYGFPTANLKLEDAYIIPKKGVYAGYVEYAQQYYPAIINIGHNPSFNYSLKTSIEAHILDFNQDIYGQRCTFHFEAYLRGEVCFEGMEALATQLKKDELQARMILKGVGS